VKRFAILFSLIATIVWAAPPNDQGGGKTWDYYDTIYKDGPCHYWREDAASGTTETDVGRNAGGSPCNVAKNGTYSAGVTLNVTSGLASEPDKAVSYDGASGTLLDLGGSSDYALDTTSTNGWAVEFWEKTSASTGYFISYFTDSGHYAWYMYNNGGALLVALKQSNCQTTSTAPQAGSGINDGNWHYIVMTAVGAGSGQISTLDTFVDGVSVSHTTSFTGTDQCASATKVGTVALANTGNLAATLDEIATYRRTGVAGLTAAQIADHYNVGRHAAHHGPAHVVGRDSFFPWFQASIDSSSLSNMLTATEWSRR
jgi:hypothetical protein